MTFLLYSYLLIFSIMKKDKKLIFAFMLFFPIVFFLLLFFVFQKNKSVSNENSSWTTLTWWLLVDENFNSRDLSITFISDKRNPETDLSSYIENLKSQVTAVSNAKIKTLDFSDSSVKEYLQKNNITTLPAIIFSTNEFDTSEDSKLNPEYDIKRYLTKMSSWEYFLNIWAIYNPFTASGRWLSILNKNVLESIKNDSFFVWENNKKIIWLEYSDLSCSYCQLFHKSGVISEIMKEFNWEISRWYNHFVVHAWKHFEVLECFSEQKWKDWFFSLLDKSFEKWIYLENDLINEAVSLWANKKIIWECLASSKFSDKIESESKRWLEVFGIWWTPASVFINSETGEYKVVRGFSEKEWKKPFIDAINMVK